MSLIRRIAQPERRDSFSNPSAELLEAMTSGQWGPSYTGKSVTSNNALSLVAVYSCVRLLSDSVGTLPLQVFKDNGASGIERITDSPLADLFGREANPELTSVDLFKIAMVHLNLHGNAYLWKERDHTGRVIALWPILPSRVRVGRDPSRNNLKIYEVQNPSTGGFAGGTDRDIVHIMGLSVDGLVGLSPIGQARQMLGIYSAHEEYQGTFYRNNAQPGGFIKTEKTMDDEGVKRLKANWDSAHKGLASAGKIGILDDGKSFESLSISMADQQFIEQQHFSISQVCNLFRVPQWMLGEATGDSLTYATVEQQSEFFATYAVSPWLVTIEQKLRADGDLITDPAVYPKFNLNALLRADLKSRYEAYALGIEKGFLGRDEARAHEDLNPNPGVPNFGPLPNPTATVAR